MPEDPFAFLASEPERPAERTKSLKSKSHWKEKLFSRDKNDQHTTDQQVEAFLGTARSKPSVHDLPATPPSYPPSSLPPSNSDVSTRRWPSVHDVSNPPVADNPSDYPSVRSRKPRARKGLKVAFTTQAPELIGEGGDESRDPPIEVSLQRSRARSRMTNDLPEEPRVPQLQVQTSFDDSDRQPDWKPPLMQNPQEAELLMSLNLGDKGSRLSFRSPESSTFAQTVRAKMQAEEGRALQNGYDDPPDDPPSPSPPPSPPAPPEHMPEPRLPDLSSHRADLSPRSPDSMYSTPLVSEADAPSYTPYRGQPSPVRSQNMSPVERPLPTVPRVSPSKLSPPKPLPAVPVVTEDRLSRPSSGGSRDGSRDTSRSPQPPKYSLSVVTDDRLSRPSSGGSRDTSRSPQPPKDSLPVVADDRLSRPSSGGSRDTSRSPQPPKYSIRSVANQLGETAFTDFKEFAERYTSLIRFSAESSKPLMETSLAEWIRAAVWWFLRGKKRLEAYARRSSPGGSIRRGPSPSARQAVIDLGKALWINETIVPRHDELTKYGPMSVDALMAVVSTTGDKNMADLLSLHQAITNHIRSLSMSIKRNNILTTLEQEEPSADQVDTSIWIPYPFFAADVSAVLSGAATRSMLVDKPGKGPTIINMMPLGDSARFFSYGSMFVQACVSSREDDNEQFAMPCVLSIIRERVDWYVCAAISSQNELVNVMIQSDKKQGPTWDDVDWQVRSNSMSVKLPRGFELDVMFQEDDFRMIWNIVKYTLKAEASLEAEEGEAVVFETTLKVFHYMDPGTPKAFPPEPLERCRIRLFERWISVTEGTGTRNVHQGFRFSVLTSPKVKTLSNVRHVVGYGTPIVFGLLRGEDGAPALMLKIKEEGRTRSMLLTFYEVAERTSMHSWMLGMKPNKREFQTPDLPTRGYSIEQPGDKTSGRSAITHLQFPAGNVSVIDQEHDYVEHGYGPTILSEHLRAFTTTEWGSVTDRINLGMCLMLKWRNRSLLTNLVGPGELKLGLEVTKPTCMSLYRRAQQDLTISVAENLINPEMPDKLTELLQTAMVKPMVRRFEFASLKGMDAS